CSFFFSSRRRHTRSYGDWSSDVCSSDLRRAQRRENVVAVVPAAGDVAARGAERIGERRGPVDRKDVPARRLERRGDRRRRAHSRSEERRVGKEGGDGVGGWESGKSSVVL